MGQVVLYIMGAATPERLRLSDNICTALQLVEHWQDVAEDLRNDRVYLPQEDLKRFEVTEASLAEPTASPNVRKLMSFESHRASALLAEGAPLVGTLKGRSQARDLGLRGRRPCRADRDNRGGLRRAAPDAEAG